MFDQVLVPPHLLYAPICRLFCAPNDTTFFPGTVHMYEINNQKKTNFEKMTYRMVLDVCVSYDEVSKMLVKVEGMC